MCLFITCLKEKACYGVHLTLVNPPSKHVQLNLNHLQLNVSRLQCVCSDRWMLWQAAVHTLSLTYHFSPWREGRGELEYWRTDVPG